ncbi:MAG TPA: hypothetical protein VJ461_01425 [Candidatus Nanoarchaeia archaeon]|nr:hypothetical protein [Candidatus Nanoarchaeia archaeon]
MEPHIKRAEQLGLLWKNMFSNTHTTVLAYCSKCLEDNKEVNLESKIREVNRETRDIQTKYDKLPQIRRKYEHTIGCREGHEVYKAEYWTMWKTIYPLPPMPT